MSFGGVGSMNIILRNNKLLRRKRTRLSEIYKDSKYLSCKMKRKIKSERLQPWLLSSIRNKLKREKYTRDVKLVVFMLFATSVLLVSLYELFSI